MGELRRSRIALVVVKLKVRGESHFLMRKDPSWRDITFIGGHANERDSGHLLRAAQRELMEEVPTLRSNRSIELCALTSEIQHGPVDSPSAGARVLYDLQFFLLVFRETPESVIGALGPRSRNVLMAQHDLLQPGRYKIAKLVDLLEKTFPGGLAAIPYSWAGDLDALSTSTAAQRDLAFR